MDQVTNDFVSNEPKEYKFKIGHLVASSLSGFIAGVILASMVWSVVMLILSE